MLSETPGRKVAALLMEAGAIKLNTIKPFQWASGWQSPIYCDNRLALSYPESRTYIRNQLKNLISEHFPEVEAIAGVATAGIPQGALVADSLNIPFVYVRSKPKGHGMENLIEGRIVEGQKIVVIEDLISTGKSSITAAKALQKAGIEVLGLAAIFTYGFAMAQKNFDDAGITFKTVSNYGYLLDEALTRNYITSEQMVSLEAWRVDPSNWIP